MDNIILSAILAFFVTFFAIPIIIQVAKEKKLYDEPDERKVHKVVIPTLGGLGIFAGFILATLMGSPKTGANDLQYFAAASIVIFFLGIKDDILILSPAKKFIGQLIAAGIAIKFGGVAINNMHGFMGIYHIPPIASAILTLFTMVVVINSFNLIDGIDGLAGSLGLLTSLSMGIYFFMDGNLSYAVMAFALCGSIIGFLIYNYSPAKIFMGDTGSLLLGLINSILVIKFINIAGHPSSAFHLNAAPAIGFTVLIVPLFDTLRVFTLRILDRRSPFSPDRNHIHHILLDLGLNHRKITLVCVFANALFITLAYLLRDLGTTYVILIILGLAISCTTLLYYIRPRKKAKKATSYADRKAAMTTTKLFTLSAESIESE